MLKIEKNTLYAGSLKLAFPAVRMSIAGKLYDFAGEGRKISKQTWEYTCEDIAIQIKVEEVAENLVRKTTKIIAGKALATPDWVEADRQKTADTALKRYGYKASTLITGRPQAEEAGGSLMPGRRLQK